MHFIATTSSNHARKTSPPKSTRAMTASPTVTHRGLNIMLNPHLS